jgi:hypothetical protein
VSLYTQLFRVCSFQGVDKRPYITSNTGVSPVPVVKGNDKLTTIEIYCPDSNQVSPDGNQVNPDSNQIYPDCKQDLKIISIMMTIKDYEEKVKSGKTRPGWHGEGWRPPHPALFIIS